MLKLSYLIVIGLAALATAWQASRFRRRMNESMATSWRCVACESPELVTLAEGVYRCRQCAYEGGPGLAAFVAAKAAAAFDRVDPAQRQAIAHRHLRDAMHLLSGMQEAPVDPGEGSSWSAAVEEIAMRAAEDLETAARAAGGPIPIPGRGPFDPRRLAVLLRQRVATTETPYDRVDVARVRETQAVIRNAAAELGALLEG